MPLIPWLVLGAVTALGVVGQTAHGQTVRARLHADSVKVGDQFTITLISTYPDSLSAFYPGRSPNPGHTGDFEILERTHQTSERTSPSIRTDRVELRATTFALDSARTDGLTVLFVAGEDTLRTASSAIQVPVTSLVPDDASDIRDLAAPFAFPRPLWPWLLGTVALATALFLWWRRRQQSDEPEQQTPTTRAVPPIDEAMSRLDALEEIVFEDPTQVKAFFVELSDVLRTYLHRATVLPARERSTSELRQLLAETQTNGSSVVPEPLHNRINVLLRLADLVKFAGIVPEPDKCTSAFRATRETIRIIEDVRQEEAANEAEAETPNEIQDTVIPEPIINP